MGLMTITPGPKPIPGRNTPGHEIIDRYTVPGDQPAVQQQTTDDFDGLMARWGQGGGQPYAGASPMATAQTRQVGPDELASNQLNKLTNSNSAYIKSARAQGNEMAAARGSLAGSYYAGASQKAAIDAAAPIAAQDAATYGRTASENMAAGNAAELENAGNATSIVNANTAASGQRFGQLLDYSNNRNRLAFDRENSTADRAQRESEFGRDLTDRRDQRNWQATENRNQRTFDRDQQNRDFRQRIAQDATHTVLNNPAYFRDPAGARGAINFYTSAVDELFPDLGALYPGDEAAGPRTGP